MSRLHSFFVPRSVRLSQSIDVINISDDDEPMSPTEDEVMPGGDALYASLPQPMNSVLEDISDDEVVTTFDEEVPTSETGLSLSSLREILTARTDRLRGVVAERSELSFEHTSEAGSSRTESISNPAPNLLLITIRDFECPVCIQFPHPPTPIYMCQNGHNQCGPCKDSNSQHAGTNCCPTCRCDGNWIRNLFYERLLEKYMNA